MKHNKSFSASLIIGLSLCIGGCATIKDAYNSTTDTVKGWVSSDTKKSDEKKPETKTETTKSEDKKSTDNNPENSQAK